jgi:glycosyltransferase 2 family protein
MNKQTLISTIKYVVGLGIGVGIFWYVFRDTPLSKMQSVLSNTNPSWLLLAFGIGLLSHFLRAVRWRMQLEASGYEVPMDNAFAAVLINYLVNLVTSRGGEIVRCSVVLRTDKVPLTSIGGVATERVIDVLMLGICMLIGLGVASEQILGLFGQMQAGGSSAGSGKATLLMGALAFGLIGFGLVILFRKRLMQLPIYQKIEKIALDLLQNALSIRKVKNPLLFIAYSFAIWVCYWLTTYSIISGLSDAEMLSQSVNLLTFAFVVNLVGAIGVAVPSPGGMGTYHLSVVISFILFHLCEKVDNCSIGNSAALVLHLTQMIILPVVGGGIAYLYLFLRKRL